MEGLLPGGGPGGRLANHFVVGPPPTQWSEARGFRRGSNAVVQCDLDVLRKAGVRLFQGADGVLLADVVPPEAIFRVLAADNQRGHYTEVLAELGADRRLRLVRDLRAEAEHMSAYMEGAARMVNFEGALSSRAGAEHSRVLEHAQELLQKSEVFLQERAEEAGAAVSGAPVLWECGAGRRCAPPSWDRCLYEQGRGQGRSHGGPSQEGGVFVRRARAR